MPSFLDLFTYQAFIPGDNRSRHPTFLQTWLHQECVARRVVTGDNVRHPIGTCFPSIQLAFDVGSQTYDLFLNSSEQIQSFCPLRLSTPDIIAALATTATCEEYVHVSPARSDTDEMYSIPNSREETEL